MGGGEGRRSRFRGASELIPPVPGPGVFPHRRGRLVDEATLLQLKAVDKPLPGRGAKSGESPSMALRSTVGMGEDGRSNGVAGAISEAVVRLVQDATGGGPAQVQTTFGDDSVTVRGITGQVEGTLFDPRAQVVLRVRGEVHKAMRADIARTVEKQLGRRVLAFIDESSPDRDLVLYVYMLAPAGSASTA